MGVSLSPHSLEPGQFAGVGPSDPHLEDQGLPTKRQEPGISVLRTPEETQPGNRRPLSRDRSPFSPLPTPATCGPSLPGKSLVWWPSTGR